MSLARVTVGSQRLFTVCHSGTLQSLFISVASVAAVSEAFFADFGIWQVWHATLFTCLLTSMVVCPVDVVLVEWQLDVEQLIFTSRLVCLRSEPRPAILCFCTVWHCWHTRLPVALDAI